MLSVPSRAAVVLTVLTLAVATACGSAKSREEPGAGVPTGVRPPPANAVFDYQLGGAYPPPAPVRVVSRDRAARPAKGLYSICYVNAFQTQPGAAVTWWREHHPDLLLKDAEGELVVDEDWDEPLLDISTPDKRAALMDIVGPWIDGCAAAHFDAVEPDNLDSYERSDGELTRQDAAAFARLLTTRAHGRGLAVAQKNTADLLPQRAGIGFDFGVVEECAQYDECAEFGAAYGGRIFAIEYVKKDFAAACRTWGKKLSLTLRDRDVRPAGSAGYVYRSC
ncbi:endo alpha-1,4 polygalactosaminidase [Streptomyces sp. NBC_00370]|uniref:endo alpha-1,4 polygalactosaminidase n=1 Tax=Streptomyces sp. NBC_00370 TaxID=2975728 RepID=UPI002E275D6F